MITKILPIFLSKTTQRVEKMLAEYHYLLSQNQEQALLFDLEKAMNPKSQDAELLETDIKFILKKDPALADKQTTEVFLYKSLILTYLHRIAHQIYERGDTTSARMLSEINREITGAEIHPGVKIGQSIFIDHPTGFIAGESASIGDYFHGHGQVLLGSDGINNGVKRHPTIGNNVTIWPKANILGAIEVGDNVIVGADAMITEDVPDNSTVVGYNFLIKENGVNMRMDLKDYHRKQFLILLSSSRMEGNIRTF